MPSGGAGESLLQIIKSAKQDHNCYILFSKEGFLKKKFDAISSEVPQYYFKTTGSWISNRDFGWWPINMARMIIGIYPKIGFIKQVRKLVKEHNIDFIYSNTISMNEGAIAAKLSGIPHLWQVRELFDLDYYRFGLSKKTVVKLLGAFSKYIVCNSYRTKEVIRHFNGNMKKVEVIYNLVNPHPKKLDIRDHLKLDPSTKIVAILGWITPNKRIEDFIDVANNFRNPKIKFLIIGGYGGKYNYDDIIKTKLKKSSNIDNIILTGILPNAVNYLSSIESFGRTVGEALIAGTPTIGIKGTATEELIQHEKSGYIVEKGDVEKMTFYTKKLLSDEELRKSMGEQGKKYMQQNFSSDSIFHQYQHLFKKTLE